MSHLWDCMGQFSGESQDYSSLTDFQADMSNFDLPLSENDPTYMSSDFFSCVDWVENTFGDDIPSNNLCPISNVQSPHSSESIDSLTLGSDATGSVTTDENINVNQVLSLENFEVTPKPEPIVNNKQRNQTTKVVLQSNPKRVVVTKPINVGNKINNKPKQQVIRVQTLNGNGSSVLLPVNVKNVKKFKIINAGDLNMENIKVTAPVNAFIKKSQITEKIMESTDEDEQEEKQHDSRYPPLNLTSEEKRLLLKEGIKLPSHYPLTKNEEKELKRIRRKIRNKISAQDSRKRKKEYVDKLEEKAKRTSEENEFLKKRIKLLRKQNGKLVEQMRRINALLQSTTSSKATPATCLMIVLFSTLLVCLPSLRLSDKQELGQQKLFAARRALLFNQKANEDDVNMDEFLVFNKEDESEIDNFVEEESENTTNEMTGVQMLMQIAKRLNDISNDKNCSDPNNNSAEEFCNRFKDQAINIYYNLKPHLEGSKPPEKGFIEPDISDDEDTGINRSGFKEEPPSKRRKLDVSDVIYQEKPSDQDLLLNYMNRKQE